MLKRLLLVAGVITAALLIGGCGGKPPAPKFEQAKPEPKWFTNPQQNDANYLYAVAGGTSSEEAVKKALAAMVSKLSVSVQSSFEKETSVFRTAGSATAQENLKSNIKTEVGKIGISNYEVVHSEKLDFRNYVAMVKSDKKKLVATLKKSLKAKMDKMNQTLQSIAQMDVLKQLFAFKDAYAEALGMTTEIMVAGELDKGYNTANALGYINNIHKRYLDIKNGIRFHVQATTRSAVAFANKIKNALAQDYALSTMRTANTINIDCAVSMHRENTGLGFSLAAMNVKVDVLSQGKKIGGKITLVKDRYKSTTQATLERGALSFGKEIQEKGIIDILGIKL